MVTRQGEGSGAAAPRACRRVLRPPSTALLLCLALCVLAAPARGAQIHRFSGSFGEAGSGLGQLEEPGGVAVDAPAGQVYVADEGNGRVERFSTAGVPLGTIDGSTTPAGGFSGVLALAADDSTSPLDPAAGDLYVADTGHGVVDRLGPDGTYETQLGGDGEAPFGPLLGIAVDRSGVLYVYESAEGAGRIDRFSPDGTFLGATDTGRGALPALAVGGGGDPIYALLGDTKLGAFDTQSGTELAEWREPFNLEEAVQAAAVDLAGDHLLVGAVVEGEARIEDFEPVAEPGGVPQKGAFGEPVQVFGFPGFSGTGGLAVDPADGAIYASEPAADRIDVFEEATIPDVHSGPASGHDEEAHLEGTVDPDGIAVEECIFEYGTDDSYGQSVPCEGEGLPGAIGTGSAPVPVAASITGLSPRTVYHYRLLAANANGRAEGTDETFTTATRPVLEESAVTDVSAGAATLRGRITPGGAATTYSFELGTTPALGSSVPPTPAPAGAGLLPEPLSVPLSGLAPGITYYYRLTASNPLGPAAPGPVRSFATQPAAGAPGLPDGRAYELVSPADKEGGEVAGQSQVSAWESSPAGDAVAYGSEQAFGDALSAAAQGQYYLARRGEDGWLTHSLLPPQAPGCNLCRPLVEAYSADLSRHVLVDGGGERGAGQDSPPLVAGEPTGVANLFLRSGEPASSRLLDPLPAGVPPATPDYQGASDGLDHVLFTSEAELIPGAPPGPNLYESEAGAPRLVGRDEAGTPLPGAVLGDGETHQTGAVSADGNRIFFEAEGGLYVREDASRTRRLDLPAGGTPAPGGGARFQLATPSGGRAYFTDDAEAGLTADTVAGSGQNLYAVDLPEGAPIDLTPGPEASVLAAIAVGGEGGRVYFLATGALTGGANPEGAVAVAGEDNLYVEEGGAGGVVRFIATLDPADLLDWEGRASERIGITTRASEDGGVLAFESLRPLTGYDDDLAGGGTCGRSQDGEELGRACTEIFLYEAGPRRLACVSCAPSGALPEGASIIGAPFQSQDELKGYVTRNLSADGRRLFFDSADDLVGRDTDGVLDVYEWEAEGEGGCTRDGGCLSLITSGTSPDPSFFEDASENGDDVFFTTSQRLLGADHDDASDLYDARVGGGLPEAGPAGRPPCVGECHEPGPGPAPPVAPPTATLGPSSGREGVHRHHHHHRCRPHRARHCAAAHHPRRVRHPHRHRKGSRR